MAPAEAGAGQHGGYPVIGMHGWVTPREDGAKARCGGPSICKVCATELALLSPRILPFENITISSVQAEMVSAIAKHGVDKTPLNSTMSNETKLVVLVEEVGEVARAMTYDNGGDKDALVRELIQVSAMALAWAQSLDQT